MLQRMVACSIAMLLAVTTVQPREPPEPLVDSLGDPLPVGAIARLGTLRFKHSPPESDAPFFRRGVVNSAATVLTAVFSPDGKRIATIAQPGQNIRVWEAASGKELHGPWDSSKDYFYAYAVAFSGDGSILASTGITVNPNVGTMAAVVLWDVATGKTLHTLTQNGGAATTLAFNDDGKTMVTVENQNGRGEAGTVRWWDIASGKQVRSWTPPTPAAMEAKNNNPANNTFYQSSFSLHKSVLAVWSIRYDRNNENGGLMQSESELTLYDIGKDQQPGRILHQARAKTNGNARLQNVAISGDGKRMAFVAEGGNLEMRDALTGKLLSTPAPVQSLNARSYIGELCLSPDGSTLALTTGVKTIVFVNQNDPTAVRELELLHTENIGRGLAFSPDGKTLLVGVGPDVRLYDVASLQEVHSWIGHRETIDAITFSADGRSMRTGTADNRNQVGEFITWDTTNWKPIQVSSRNAANKAGVGVVSPDHTLYFGSAANERLNLYERATGQLVGRLTVPGQQNNNAALNGLFSPDGKYFVLQGPNVAGKNPQYLYAIPSCKLVCELPSPVNENFRRFAVAPGYYGARTSRQVVFSANGRIVALFAGDDGRICVIETSTGKIKHRLGYAAPKDQFDDFGQPQVQAGLLELSPDGKLLASWSVLDNAVRIWDLASGKERRSLPRDDAVANGVQFAWSPDGRTLAIAKRQTIQLWEASTLRLRKEFTGNTGEVRAMAFSPNGHRLATAGSDTTALIWDVWGQ
jgi:WD40 repeat protein